MNKEILRVDCNGIYYGKELVADWNNFLQAYIGQANKAGSISDDFQLILEYRKDNSESYFTSVIPLTNTQDQSEENVLEAILRFYQLSLGEVTKLNEPLQIENNGT